MPSSISRSLSSQEQPLPRRIRHITSIQIRNLTPFPVRDTFASALTRPSEQPQFTPHGRLSDDLDITLGRKRGRRFSSASNASFHSTRPDGDEARRALDQKKKQSSRPGESISRSPESVSSPGRQRGSSTGATPMVRPSHRQRTSSMASSLSRFSEQGTDSGTSPSISIPSFLRDVSQLGLERVLRSRLVETYITISIPHTQGSGSMMENGLSSSPARPELFGQPSRRHVSSMSMSSSSSPSPPSQPPNAIFNRGSPTSHVKSVSSTFANGLSARQSRSPSSKSQPMKSPPLSNRLRSSTSSSLSGSNLPSPEMPDITPQFVLGSSSTPDYRSPIHRPSTNPTFIFDARSEFKHVHGADLSGAALCVEVWANVPCYNSPNDDTKGKGKGKAKEDYHNWNEVEWKVLERWNVNLSDLQLLPRDLASHPNQLPSNTLLITLSPSNETYFLPSSHLSQLDTRISKTRPPSPSGVYSSDPESEIHKSRVHDSPAGIDDLEQAHDEQRPGKESSEDSVQSPNERGISRKDGQSKTANWQDTLKVVTLQTIILDTQSSLADVVHEIDHLVIHNTTATMTREVYEREACVRELEAQKGAVQDACQNLRNEIDLRKEALRQRRRTLDQALQTHSQDVDEEEDREDQLEEERESLSALRRLLPPIRSSLLTVLVSIYPIEPLSPADLLFTILDVPLPIPLAPTDPAPPLSLPGRPEITEDVVATALGYAAQAVQLLAAYMNKTLTYPVTCVGSRSLIKDGISAMVGPRMFPLYSKGVDTYRFEYAVFLLNKDIELLMSDRDLRALDMRHTLPNLKNLLLTLTDPESTPNVPLRAFEVPSESDSGLQSPVISSSSLSPSETIISSDETSHGELGKSQGENERDGASTNGTVTPTAKSVLNPSTATSRKSRAFLDLGPLTGFLRARYPSSSRSSTHAVDSSEGEGSTPTITVNGVHSRQQDSGAGSCEDEDDRRTIRASSGEDDLAESKQDLDAQSNGDAGHDTPRPPTAHGAEKIERQGLQAAQHVTVETIDSTVS